MSALPHSHDLMALIPICPHPTTDPQRNPSTTIPHGVMGLCVTKFENNATKTSRRCTMKPRRRLKGHCWYWFVPLVLLFYFRLIIYWWFGLVNLNDTHLPMYLTIEQEKHLIYLNISSIFLLLSEALKGSFVFLLFSFLAAVILWIFPINRQIKSYFISSYYLDFISRALKSFKKSQMTCSTHLTR